MTHCSWSIAVCASAILTVFPRPSLGGPPVECPADINGDTLVNVDDLLLCINAWGPNPGNPSDLDADGDVDVDDLVQVIDGWGPCVPPTTPTEGELAGLARSVFPHFEHALTFNVGAHVELGLDPFIHPDLVGVNVDVYVVADRSASEWAADQSLVDVRASGAQPATFSGPDIQSNIITIDSGSLSAAAGTGLGVGYDVVIDADQNGLLGADDVIDGADGAGFFIVHDISTSGPLAVTAVNYTGGTFLGQRTHYPSGIASMGQLPLIVISHGNGHQYTWYDYLQSHLASYGYIVMSHQNNTVPGVESASTTTLTNTNYILANQATIAGGVLNGHIDGHTIVWIGHSRGGEGVVRAYDRIFDGTYTPANFGLSDIKLISSIAPTDFLGTASANPHNVAYHLIYGSSDGDVCGCPDNDIADSFNLFERAAGPRSSTYVHGADHNDFNCCGVNDFSGPAGTAIGAPEAQDVAQAAYLALVKYTLEGNLAAKDFLWRQWETVHPAGVNATTIVVNEHKNAVGDGGDIVIDNYQNGSATSISSSSGAVTFSVLNLVEGITNDNNLTFTWFSTDPQNGHVRGRTTDTTRGAVFDFNAPVDPVFVEFEVLPALADWSGQAFLTFRAAQGTRHPETVAVLGDLDFHVILRDTNGVTSAINFAAYSGGIEEPYPRTGFGTGAGWQNEYEVIRIRLGDFLANGSPLDLSSIAAIRFEFGGPNASARGRIGLDDVIITAN